jgi:hypothetical protein
MAFKYLTRTPSVDGNRKTWTFSAWIKRGKIDAVQCFMGSNQDSPFQFTSDNKILLVIPASTQSIKTTRLYRDTSNWFHIVVMCDTTQATASNRLKIYTNGVLETSLDATTYPTQNVDTGYNTTSYKMFFGANRDSDLLGFDGEMTDFYWVDGQALDASYFGQTNATTGQWIPKSPAAVRTGVGSFGTNGCYLPFNNRASTTTLGYDYKTAARSSNNDWTLNNMSVTDGFPDGYDNNFCTFNTNSFFDARTFSDGNLRISGGNDGLANYGLTSGKWYWEMQRTNTGVTPHWGIVSTNYNRGGDSLINGTYAGCILIRNDYSTGDVNGQFQNAFGISSISSELGTPGSTANGDILSFHLDLDASPKTFKIYKNGSSGTPIMSRTFNFETVNGNLYQIFPYARNNSGAETLFNFGQGSTGSNYSDGNGYGKFNYQPPSGFLSICEKNIANPTITNPKLHFDVLTYTGNGSYPRTITGLAFQPDFVWLKNRNVGYYHQTYDAVRGTGTGGGVIYTNVTDVSDDTYKLSSFNSDGFTLNSSHTAVNGSGEGVVAFCWKAGNGTVTNTAGTITSTVSVNAAAGFSIVKYNTGSNSGAYTVGHGLNAIPKFIMVKGAYNSVAYNWDIYHVSSGANKRYNINSNSGEYVQAEAWNNTTPSSTLIYQNNNGNSYYGANKDMIAYCWAEVKGFSKFGYYVGNGSSDGPYVSLGFKPRFLMIKRLDTTGDWCMYDTARTPNNVVNIQVFANANSSEGTIGGGTFVDILSNGFKCRNAADDKNNASGQYIYMAWAESPIDFANAR